MTLTFRKGHNLYRHYNPVIWSGVTINKQSIKTHKEKLDIRETGNCKVGQVTCFHGHFGSRQKSYSHAGLMTEKQNRLCLASRKMQDNISAFSSKRHKRYLFRFYAFTESLTVECLRSEHYDNSPEFL